MVGMRMVASRVVGQQGVPGRWEGVFTMSALFRDIGASGGIYIKLISSCAWCRSSSIGQALGLEWQPAPGAHANKLPHRRAFCGRE